MSGSAPTPEFSRPLVAADLAAGTTELALEADDRERRALAGRFGLLALDLLRATLRLTPSRGGTVVRIAGHLEADVTQACVVTLEPVRSRFGAEFEILYSAEAEAPPEDPRSVTHVFTLEDEVAEPLVGGIIDVGEAVAEQLSLELDPFPRKEGAVFPGISAPDGNGDDGAGGGSPFAVLAGLKGKRDDAT